MRIPDRYFPHRITTEDVDPMGGGRRWKPAKTNVKALVAPKDQLIVDQRPDAESNGQQIMANTMIIVQPESRVSPGARVTIWPTSTIKPPRVLSIAAVDDYDHDIAPNSVVLWAV